eukprot:1879279-Rhodomonas_salina.1
MAELPAVAATTHMHVSTAHGKAKLQASARNTSEISHVQGDRGVRTRPSHRRPAPAPDHRGTGQRQFRSRASARR